MSDPVPAVAEADASGETAAIFADIRAVYGVGVVNLIWRHLATMPGALPWAWGTVRPLYLDGTIGREAAALGAARRLPALPALPAEVLAAAGIGPAERQRIIAVLDAYDRTNPMALVALAVLRQRLTGAGGTAAPAPIPAAAHPPPPEIALPPLLRLEDMAPETAALVLRLNRIGATVAEPILASMYRTLAHWPPYLALAWTLLAPAGASGGLQAAIGDALALAGARAAAIPGGGTAAPLPEAVRPAVLAALDRFTADAIARMLIICGALRRATAVEPPGLPG